MLTYLKYPILSFSLSVLQSSESRRVNLERQLIGRDSSNGIVTCVQKLGEGAERNSVHTSHIRTVCSGC